MNKTPNKIEDLLERMGTQEVPGEPEHRYELRRALLCSERFDCNSKTSRWDRWMSYTLPLVTGSVVVGALVIFATHIPMDQLRSTSPGVVPLEMAAQGPTQASIAANEYLSDPTDPLIALAGFNPSTTKETVRAMKVTPLFNQPIVMVR